MGRQPRVEVPGGYFHVTSRGVNGERIFVGGRDRHLFIRAFEGVVVRCDWTCFAYCLMDNHFHLVIRTNEPTLAAGMHLLNARWARFVNAEYGRNGHLFGRRFWSKLIEDDGQLLETCRYVVLNPVRAHLCDDEADWLWSSHRAMIGLEQPRPFLAVRELLEMFHEDRAHAREAYQRFVVARRLRPRPLEA